MNFKSAFLLVLAAIVLTPSAFALPIFSENRAIHLPSGVVLYPDSEDPNLSYYFPGNGGLKRETSGMPLFGMTYWGLRKASSGEVIPVPGNSGAFLSFAARLYSTPEQTAELDAQKAAGGRIAVLPVQASTIELNSTRDSGIPLSKFFEEFNLSRKGGQADSDISLNASLTGLGAMVFAQQLKNPMILKIDYCYQALGLSPLFKGVVQLNWSTVHENLKASFSVGGFFSRKEVNVTLQRLIKNGTLKIQIDAAHESEAKYEDFIMKIADMLMNRMFKNEIAAAAPGAGGSMWSFYNIGLDYGRSEVSENIEISFSRREQQTLERCIPINASGAQDHFSEVVKSADGINVF